MLTYIWILFGMAYGMLLGSIWLWSALDIWLLGRRFAALPPFEFGDLACWSIPADQYWPD